MSVYTVARVAGAVFRESVRDRVLYNLVAFAVLFIGLTILITFVARGARIDLTESNLYSIAPGTQRIVSSLKEGEKIELV